MPMVPERLRPSIIIFTDDLGAPPPHLRAREHGEAPSVLTFLQELSVGINPALRPAICALRVNGAALAEVAPLWPSPAASRESGDFGTVFTHALMTVQSEEVYRVVRTAGITMLDMNAQIFIVGTTHSPTPSLVATAVTEITRARPINTQVSYLLKRVVGDPDAQESAWTRDLVSENGDLPRVNFCYFFDDFSERGTFYDTAQIHYVMAEALFGLSATGMHAAEVYRATLETTPLITDPDQRIGSISPVMVRFPRAEITSYCADVLAEQVVEEWIDSIHDEDDTAEDVDASAEAERRAEEIYADIGDAMSRPGITSRSDSMLARPWRYVSRLLNRSERPAMGMDDYPALGFLSEPPRVVKPSFAADDTYYAMLDQDVECVQHMDMASAQVFSYLKFDEIKRGARARAWQHHAREAYFQAGAAFSGWGKAAEIAFIRAGSRLESELEAEIDTMFVDEANGLTSMRSYLARLDDSLRECSLWLRDNLRAKHQASYEGALNYFKELAERPRWAVIDNPDRSPQATRRFNDAFATAAPAGATDDGRPLLARPDVARDDSEIALSEVEQHVIDGLEARLKWMDEHIPKYQMILGFVAVATIVLTVLLYPYILFLVNVINRLPAPLGWVVQLTAFPTNVVATMAVVVSVLFSLGQLFRWFTLHRRTMAGRDLLEMYRLCLVYRAEIREDQLRVGAVLGPLTAVVSKWNDTARQYKGRVAALKGSFSRSATQRAEQMFRGPKGVRDILVGNGQELSPTGYSPADFYREIDRQRITNEREDLRWHRSFADINERLRTHLITHQRGTISMLAEGSLDGEIREYMADIVGCYLTDRMVDINYALTMASGDGGFLWRQALDRATMLFASPSPMPPYLFFAGRAEDTSCLAPNLMPRDATEIRTSHPEWLYIALLNQGDAGTVWGQARQEVGENTIGKRMRAMQRGASVRV